jgi:hypothetical protein
VIVMASRRGIERRRFICLSFGTMGGRHLGVQPVGINRHPVDSCHRARFLQKNKDLL